MQRPSDPILDPRVARAKFGAAERLYEHRAAYHDRGWRIEPPAFPDLVVTFVSADAQPRAGVRLGLRNYDLLPPSVVFLRGDGRPHTPETLGLLLRSVATSHVPPAIQNGLMLVASTGGYLPGTHPLTQHPFLCVPGTWEFHTHPQHANVLWEWIRPDPAYGLQYLIEHAYGALRPEVFA